MKPVDVGVLFRNNRELVDPFFFFLKSARHRTAQVNVIAIDQESTDGTLDALRNHGTPIRGLHRGIAFGRNCILHARTNGHNLLLVDSDVFFARNDTISKMSIALESDPMNGICYCPVSSFYTGKIDTGFCCVMIADEALRSVGEFDEQFEMFYDDSDYFNRVIKAGFKVVTAQDCFAIHIWGSTTHDGSEGHRKSECLKLDEAKYKRKWS